MTKSQTISVLIVEDFAPIRQRLRSLLSAADGIEVVGEAADAGEALRLFAVCRPDAVVLDIQLPEGNGIDLLRTIKAARPGCVVMMLTSHGAQEFRETCLESGADYFFQKATEFERVVETLKGLRPA